MEHGDQHGGDHHAAGRTSFGTLDLKVNFLRPVKPDGRATLVAKATVEQRGRTIAASTVRIDDADGRRVAIATGGDDLRRPSVAGAHGVRRRTAPAVTLAR